MKRYRRLLTLLVIVVLYFSVPFFVNTVFNRSLENSPVVLVVGDLSDEGFGSLVNSGVIAAQKESAGSDTNIAIRTVSVNEAAWRDAFGGSNSEELDREITALRSNLIKEISTHNVIAVISANTSQTVPTVLQVGKTFNIPVLITVATNTEVTNGYSDIALRFIALDSKQAEAIQEWCEKQGTRIGLIYDLTRYGTGLRDALTQRVGPSKLIPFSVNTTTDIAGILIYGEKAGVQSWVVVGYRDQAREFYSKKVSSGVKGKMLFSDGAYGKWLSELPSDPTNSQEVFFSFPTLAMISPSVSAAAGANAHSTEIRGYGTLGFDAYCLIDSAVRNLKETGNSQKYSLMQAIRDMAANSSGTVKVKQSYRFDAYGENERASFSVIEVRHEFIP